MDVTIKPAEKSDRGIFENLLELYLHDFSAFAPVEIRQDGHFGYPFLDKYWSDPDRFAFLILADARLAGFALVRQKNELGSGTRTTDLAEFFVLRQFRRQQVGSRAAIMIWDLFPGPWQVRVLVSNRSAYPFWKKLITAYSPNQFEETKETSSLGETKQFSFEGKTDAKIHRR